MNRHPLGRHPAELLTQSASPPRSSPHHTPAQPSSVSQPSYGDPLFSDGELVSWDLHNDTHRIPRKKGIIDPAVARIPTITDKIDMIQENFIKDPDSPLFKMSVNRLVYLFVQHVEDVQGSILASRMKSFETQRRSKQLYARPPKPSSQTCKRKRRPVPSSLQYLQPSFPASRSHSHSDLDYDDGNSVNNESENTFRPDGSHSAGTLQRRSSLSKRQSSLEPKHQGQQNACSSQHHKKSCKSSFHEADNSPYPVSHRNRHPQKRIDDEADSENDNEDWFDLSERKAGESPSPPPNSGRNLENLAHQAMRSSKSSPHEQTRERCSSYKSNDQSVEQETAIPDVTVEKHFSSQEEEEQRTYTVRPKMTMPPFDRILVSDYASLTPIIDDSDDDTFTENERRHSNRHSTIARYLQEHGYEEDRITVNDLVRTGGSSHCSSGDPEETVTPSQKRMPSPSSTSCQDVSLAHNRACDTSQIDKDGFDTVRLTGSYKNGQAEHGKAQVQARKEACANERGRVTDLKLGPEKDGSSSTVLAKLQLEASGHKQQRTGQVSEEDFLPGLTRMPSPMPGFDRGLQAEKAIKSGKNGCTPLLSSTSGPSLNYNPEPDSDTMAKAVLKPTLASDARLPTEGQPECVCDSLQKNATPSGLVQESNSTVSSGAGGSVLYGSGPGLTLKPTRLSVSSLCEVLPVSGTAFAHDVVPSLDSSPKLEVVTTPFVARVPMGVADPRVVPDPDALCNIKDMCGSKTVRDTEVARDPGMSLDPRTVRHTEATCGPGAIGVSEVVRDPEVNLIPNTARLNEVAPSSDLVRSLKNALHSEVATVKKVPSATESISASEVVCGPVKGVKSKGVSISALERTSLRGPMLGSDLFIDEVIRPLHTHSRDLKFCSDGKFASDVKFQAPSERNETPLSPNQDEVHKLVSKTDVSLTVSEPTSQAEYAAIVKNDLEKQPAAQRVLTMQQAPSSNVPLDRPSPHHATGSGTGVNRSSATTSAPAHVPAQNDFDLPRVNGATSQALLGEKQASLPSETVRGQLNHLQIQHDQGHDITWGQKSEPSVNVETPITSEKNWRIVGAPLDVRRYEYKIRKRLMRDCIVSPTLGDIGLSFFPVGDVNPSLSTEEFIKQAGGLVVGAPGILVREENGPTYYQGTSCPNLPRVSSPDTGYQATEDASRKRCRSPSPQQRNVAHKASKAKSGQFSGCGVRDVFARGANGSARFENEICTIRDANVRGAPLNNNGVLHAISSREHQNTEDAENRRSGEMRRLDNKMDTIEDRYGAEYLVTSFKSSGGGKGDLSFNASVGWNENVARSEQVQTKEPDTKAPGQEKFGIQLDSGRANESRNKCEVVGVKHGMSHADNGEGDMDVEKTIVLAGSRTMARRTSGISLATEERQVHCEEEIDVTRSAGVGASELESVCATKYGPFAWTSEQFEGGLGLWDNDNSHGFGTLNNSNVSTFPRFRGIQNGACNVNLDFNPNLNDYDGFEASGSMAMNPGVSRQRQVPGNARADAGGDQLICHPLGSDESIGSEGRNTVPVKHSARQDSCWQGRSYSEALRGTPLDVNRYQVYSGGDQYRDRRSSLVEDHFVHSTAPGENDGAHMGPSSISGEIGVGNHFGDGVSSTSLQLTYRDDVVANIDTGGGAAGLLSSVTNNTANGPS